MTRGDRRASPERTGRRTDQEKSSELDKEGLDTANALQRCPRCQAENAEGARFCEDCGARLELACPSCGEPVGAGKKFCRSCGAALTAEPGRFASPQSYTPKHLAEKILTSKSALEGERKQVTVLFADLKGSMELLADRDPEEARKLLDPVLERMMEAVHRYEGTVNQVMGDGIMALFGAPLAHEDHAVRACYAALQMQDSVKRYAEEVHRTVGVPIHIRVGLNSGEVVVRSIGSDLHMDYTAVGQTTHLASRVEQMAMPGTILIPPETLRLAEGYVQVKPLGPRPVKGLDAPIEVFEVVGAGAVRSRLHAAAARGLSRFVGRDAELEQLRQALERAGMGHGQVVAVVGEPGVGKSRLYWEFTHSHRTQDWLIVESGSVSYGKASTYLPVIDLLKAYFQIEARDEARKIREKVTGRLLSLDRALEPSLPALLWLLEVPVDDPQWQRLDPPQRRQQTLDGIKRLLLRESQVQPLLVMFEDLHWIDAESQALLDSLVESLPTARLLLLVNYRPEYQHAWGGKTYYRQLRIDPLSPESAEQLLQSLLGTDAGLHPLKQLLIKRTEGNPFFLEESVRTLIETQVLVGERGAYRLAKPIGSIQVPATVQAVLAARIDRLPQEERRLLQSASVVGEDVPFALLQAIADLPEEGLRRSLTSLQALEFLYETSLFPELEYTFKHALTYQVAYDSLLQERRRLLHARIVESTERLYGERLAEQAERLAHHALRGELWDKAVAYFRQAGAKALARSAYREALACLEQALTALKHLPESRDTLGQAIDLRFDLRHALFPLAELQRMSEYLYEAESLAATLGDQRRSGWVSVYLAHYLWATGDAARARRSADDARAAAEALGDFTLKVPATFYDGVACYSLGDYRRAVGLLREVAQSLEGDLSRDRFALSGFPAVMSRTFWAFSLAACGTFEEGHRVAQEGLRLADALDHPYTIFLANWAPVMLLDTKGDLAPATHAAERLLALAREWDLAVLFPFGAWLLGAVYALSGRVSEGLGLLEEAEQAFQLRGGRLLYSRVVVSLGEACMLADRPEEASVHARRALDFSRERGERGHEAWALRLLGDISLRQDPPDPRGEDHYRQAMALAEELGMHPLLAHCHLGLGKLYKRTGDHPKAQEYLTTATTMLREMDMRFWLEQAEAEMKELD